MSDTPFPSATFFAASVASIVSFVLYPVVLAVIARRKLGVGWRYFWYGAAIFFAFQLLTRVPAVQLIQVADCASATGLGSTPVDVAGHSGVQRGHL